MVADFRAVYSNAERKYREHIGVVFKTAWMKAIVLAHMQKQLASAGFYLKLNNVIVDEERKKLQIYCEFSNVTIGDIYKLFFSYEGENEDPYFESVVKPI